MLAVSFNGEDIERTNSPIYLGIRFDRMLTYKTQVQQQKTGLPALEAMASKGIEQLNLFLPYHSVALGGTDYCVGLTTLSQFDLLKVDSVQDEAMRVILGTTKDTPFEATHAHTHIHTHACTHARERAHTHTHNTHRHSYTDTDTDTHTHTHSQILSLSLPSPFSLLQNTRTRQEPGYVTPFN